jgi:hypothetical protein
MNWPWRQHRFCSYCGKPMVDAIEYGTSDFDTRTGVERRWERRRRVCVRGFEDSNLRDYHDGWEYVRWPARRA